MVKKSAKKEEPTKKTTGKAPKIVALKNRTVIRFKDFKVTIKPRAKGITVAQAKGSKTVHEGLDAVNVVLKGKQVNFVIPK